MTIRAEHLSVSFEDKVVLDDLSLAVPDTGLTCIFGPSGCGKTTLFRCLAGLQRPQQGRVLGLEQRTISMVFQENRLLPWFDALENVALVVNGDRSEAEQALAAMELEEAAHQWPSQLSGGMQRRLALARAWAYNGDALLLDEPTAGLDEALAGRIMERLLQRWQNRPALLITHESWLAERFADRIYIASGLPLRLEPARS